MPTPSQPIISRSEFIPKGIPGQPTEVLDPGIREELRVKLGDEVLKDRPAVAAYFAKTASALREITDQVDIKAGACEIDCPVEGVNFFWDDGVVTDEEQAALESWMQEQLGGRPLAAINTQDLIGLGEEIRRYIADNRPQGSASSTTGEGVHGIDLLQQYMDGQLIIQNDKTRRQVEEVVAQIQSGKIKDPFTYLTALLMITETQKDAFGQAILRESVAKTDQMEAMIRGMDEGRQAGDLSQADLMTMNAGLTQTANDLQTLTFAYNKVLGDTEQMTTFVVGTSKDHHRGLDQLSANTGRAGPN